MTFKITQAVKDDMVAHAKLIAPNTANGINLYAKNFRNWRQDIPIEKIDHDQECCGMIGGRDGVALKVYPCRNAMQSAGVYTIDPMEMFQVVRQIKKDGLELIGGFHSHLNMEAYPSNIDINDATSAELVYVIIGLGFKPEQVRAYHIDKSKMLGPLRYSRRGRSYMVDGEGVITELKVEVVEG